MFKITMYKLGNEPDYCEFQTTMEYLVDAEIIAQVRATQVFGVTTAELVYIEDLDYYVYIDHLRIGRVTIKPIYEETKQCQKPS